MEDMIIMQSFDLKHVFASRKLVFVYRLLAMN